MAYPTPTLIERLRGIYNIPLNDGLGPLDGKDVFTREFKGLPAVYGMAADMIEALDKGEAVEQKDRDNLVDWLLTPDYYMPGLQPYVPPILEQAAERIRELFPK